MLTMSKPLSAGHARRYHEEEFQNARENYYTEGAMIRGVWYGQLAERWGLVGEVREDQFERLAEGQHPMTGEQLVRHQTARETKNAHGENVTTMEHRAGWDATFSAPKSVSITALVGSKLKTASLKRIDRAPRLPRSPRIRRGKPSWMSRMRRCSTGTSSLRSSLGISRRGSWRPANTGARMTSSTNVTRRMRHGGRSPSRAIAIWNAKPSSRSGRFYVTRCSGRSGRRALTISNKRSIGAPNEASSSP